MSTHEIVEHIEHAHATLREIRVSPVKSLGQNFLHDHNVARWIVDQADLSLGDFVVEIGPGLGALTEIILARGAHVLALEKELFSCAEKTEWMCFFQKE